MFDIKIIGEESKGVLSALLNLAAIGIFENLAAVAFVTITTFVAIFVAICYFYPMTALVLTGLTVMFMIADTVSREFYGGGLFESNNFAPCKSSQFSSNFGSKFPLSPDVHNQLRTLQMIIDVTGDHTPS